MAHQAESQSDNEQGKVGSTPWDLEDHIRGVLYGNCIGDAIGLLTEFLSKEEAKSTYGDVASKLEYVHKVDDFHRSRWVIGDWTDDSDQMILIMQSILENNGKIDDVDFGRKLKRWARKGFPELGDLGGCGIGSTTYHVLNHKMYDTAPAKAAEDIWELTGRFVAPNGAVMRTSILGLHQFWDLPKVIQNTIKMSKVTHADPRCTASCIAVTCAIAFMLQRKQQHLNPNGTYNISQIIEDSFQEGIKCFPKGNDEYIKEMHYHMVECKDLAGLKLDEDKKIGYTFKCLGAGFWALRQEDFRTALQQIVMEAGDADTNGAVAGALLGCKVGYNNLPETWKTGLAEQQQQWFGKIVEKFLRLLYQDLPKEYEEASHDGPPQAGQSETAMETDASANKQPDAASQVKADTQNGKEKKPIEENSADVVVAKGESNMDQTKDNAPDCNNTAEKDKSEAGEKSDKTTDAGKDSQL